MAHRSQVNGAAGAEGPPAVAPDDGPGPVCVSDYEAIARQRLSTMVWEFLRGGAQDEMTARWNVEAFKHIRLQPRVLVDVSHIDIHLDLLGQQLHSPVILAPAGYHRLFHPDGELATARGASAANVPFVVSTMATASIEDIAGHMTSPLWFQLYVAASDHEYSRELVRRAEEAGCRAICLTVDAPVIGIRNFEQRVRFKLPEGLELPLLRGLKQSVPHSPKRGDIYSFFAADLTWKAIDWLRSFVRVPLLLKGIQSAEDADRAVNEGIAGIIVSNTGGRNLDTGPATIDALPPIADRVAGRIPILLDGGIRRGTDILKALALGATSVLIGRAYLYGLATSGAEGVTDVVTILLRELRAAMALTGRASLKDIGRDTVIEPR